MKNQTFLKMKRLIDIINTDNEPNIINDMVFGDDNLKTNNMSKQTAVEWLINELKKSKHYQQMINEVHQNSTVAIDVIEQAKAMEKEQIIDAYKYGNQSDVYFKPEQYYNEQFKNK